MHQKTQHDNDTKALSIALTLGRPELGEPDAMKHMNPPSRKRQPQFDPIQ
jgi:hypothetical protein